MAIQKKTYIDFLGGPEPSTQLTGASGGTGVAAGSDNDINQWQFANGAQLEVLCTAANADIVPVKSAGVGLVIPNDNTANEGIEMTVSDSLNSTGPCYTIGTDAAFRIDVKFKITDVSDYDVACVGFRKQAAYTAAVEAHAELITDYDDVALLNVNAGDIFTGTRLNAGTGTLTDTTDNWADTATKTLSVLVSSAGVTTFQIDGAAPTTTQTHTFDDGDVVIPFVAFTKAATSGDTPPTLVSWFSGHQ